MLVKILRKNIDLLYMFALAFFLELVFAGHFGIFNIHPDMFLILVLFLAIYYSKNVSLYTALALGVLRDVLGVSPLGLYILGFLLCRFIIDKLKKKIYPGRLIIDACLVFIAAVFSYLYLSIITNFQNSSLLFKNIPLGLIVGSAFYTTLISIPAFLIFKQIKAFKAHR